MNARMTAQGCVARWLLVSLFSALPLNAQTSRPEALRVHEHALTLMAEGRPDEARGILESTDQALVLGHAPAAALLGTLRRQAGELEEAMVTFQGALDAGGGDMRAALWTELAVTRSWTGDLAGAEAAYRSALQVRPAHAPALSGLARVLRWQGDTDEARSLYEELLTLEGQAVEAYVGLGFLALEAVEADEARRWFVMALEAAPENVEARQGLDRLHEARRWQLRWAVTGVRGLTAEQDVTWNGSAAYRVTPSGTARASLAMRPTTQDVAGSDPNANELNLLAWSASVGWSQEITRNWNASLSVDRLASQYGGGYLVTLGSGRRLGSAWSAGAGVRGGYVPRIGKEAMGWASLTRIGAERRAASVTFFYGSDFREAWSRSVLLAGSAGLGERITLRGTVAKGWTSTVGFQQGTFETRVAVGGGREVVAEVFRFDGAYRSTGLRLGGKLGF